MPGIKPGMTEKSPAGMSGIGARYEYGQPLRGDDAPLLRRAEKAAAEAVQEAQLRVVDDFARNRLEFERGNPRAELRGRALFPRWRQYDLMYAFLHGIDSDDDRVLRKNLDDFADVGDRV